MTTLSKTDTKYLALLKPYLGDLQAFVDLHIQGASTMTAAAIHKGFVAETNCDLSSDDFIKGFRVSVRIDRITGIESAKRLGYRRVGEDTKAKSVADMTLDSIEPYLEDLQSFIDLHIQGSTRMTAAVIYEKFKAEQGCDLTEEQFVKAFRLALREGKIVGLESAYRFGYKRVGAQIESDTDDSTTEPKSGYEVCEIVIDDRRKLIALDRFNWGYQVRKDSGKWNTEGYYSSMNGAVHSLARKLMDDELKGMEAFTFDKFEGKLLEAENRLASLLQKAMGKKAA